MRKPFIIFLSLLSASALASLPARQPAQSSSSDLAKEFSNFEKFKEFAGNSSEMQLKFIMPDFQAGKAGSTLFMSPTTYRFHDDWFLMQLFNGKTIPQVHIAPYGNLKVKKPLLLQEKLMAMPELPPGIIKMNDRVVADVFYKMGSGADRKFGLGSVIYSLNAARPLSEIVAFDMVFNDEPTALEVEIMWSRLSKALKRQDLRWLPRSAKQETLAKNLQGQSLWANRIVMPSDFILPGEIRIYSKSVVAGVPVYFPKGTYDPSRLTSQNIAVLEELPDDLPPVRGIVTSVPQTELAHVNILARARGTLNVFVADPVLFSTIKQKAAEKKPMAFSVLSEKLYVTPLTEAEYENYQKYFTKDLFSLPQFDVSQLQYLYDLPNLSEWTIDQIVRTVGGKSLGMTRLIQTPEIPRPAKPKALSVRAYQEHMNVSLKPLLQDTLNDDRFKSDAKIRYLVLEGPKKFKALYPQGSLEQPYADLIAGLDNSSLGKVVSGKGVKNLIEDQPLNAELESKIISDLSVAFPNLPKGQGFRFRSSADVEDIPGFVGAGLYDSFSGYLSPSTQALNDDEKKKTVARAVKKTWASYWNYRAFEERTLSKIDHLSGSMAVMIHPNFPEAAEKANGVLTISWEKSDYGQLYQIQVNTHAGEIAVVRPDGSIGQPQMIDMTYTPFNQDVYYNKYIANTEGKQVLSKAQAKELAKLTVKVLESWLDAISKDVKPEWRATHYALDLEFKVVPAGWLENLSTTGVDTFVLKQARPLMKSQKLSSELTALPIPRALLGEATKIIRRTVKADQFDFSTIEVYKKETAYDGAFNANAIFNWKQDIGGQQAGTTTELKHTDFESSGHGFMHHGPWDFSFRMKAESAQRSGLQAFQIYDSGGWTVDLVAGQSIQGRGSFVETVNLLESHESWLKGIVCQKENSGDSNPSHPGSPFNVNLIGNIVAHPTLVINPGIGIGQPGLGLPDHNSIKDCGH